MVKQAPVKITIENAQESTMQYPSIRRKPLPDAKREDAQSSTMQSPSIERKPLPDAKPENTPPSKMKKLVRKLTNKVKPSKEDQASPPREQEPAEDKLAGFMQRNPKLYIPEKTKPKRDSLEIPEPMVRVSTLSRSQRLLERLEAPLIIDPTPEEEIEEQEKAKETMRQSRAARFRNRLEDYL